MITIYKITNRLNWKIYVGQTRQSIEKRFIQHSKTDSPLGQAMQDCGLDNFTIEVIEECETQEQANERERFWIRVLKSKMPNGYNRTNGGEGGIHKPRIISLNKEVFVMAIGDNIKNLRLKHGLSQLELANVAGVSDKAVSSWEQNKSVPRMGPIQKMADFFGIQKSDIIEPSDVAIHTSKGRNIKNETPLNHDESKLLADYRNLNGNNRQAVNVMIALFLSQQKGGDDNFTQNEGYDSFLLRSHGSLIGYTRRILRKMLSSKQWQKFPLCAQNLSLESCKEFMDGCLFTYICRSTMRNIAETSDSKTMTFNFKRKIFWFWKGLSFYKNNISVKKKFCL